MNTDRAVCLLALGVAMGCGGRVNNDSNNAGVASTEPTSGCEHCCMPMKLRESKVDVYQVAGMTSVELIVERVGPPQVWEPSAAVVTAWGQQQCQSGRYSANAHYGLILCSVGATDITAGCDNAIDVEISLRSKTYATETSTEPMCDDTDFGPTATFSLPIKCATCPSATESLDDETCDNPEGRICGAGPEPPPGGVRPLTCMCRVTSDTGDRVWDCS